MKSSEQPFGTIFSLFLVLLMLSIPFSYNLLPPVGLWIAKLWEPILAAIGHSLLPDCTECIWEVISDSHGIYLMAVLTMLMAIVVYTVLRRTSPTLSLQLQPWLRTILLIYLSMQLAHYGVQKLLMQQFFPPESNTLFTPLGMLEKDILYWSTMGASRSYNIFLGVMEILPAIFLLYYRTRTLALGFSTMVLLHVLFTDISYDIDVKFYALFLLSISVYLLIRPVRMAISNSTSEQIYLPNPRYLGASHRMTKTRPFVYAFLLLEVCYPIAQDMRGSVPDEMIGAYEVIHTANDSVKRIFIHSQGYLITQDDEDRFEDHAFVLDPSNRTIYLTAEKQVLAFQANQALELTELKDELADGSIHWVLRKIDLQELPLLKDRTEWTVIRSGSGQY